jgi:predicted transcriptional regulator
MAMTLRLTEEQDAKLSEFANALGLSKQQAVSKAIDEYLATQSEDAIVKRAFELVMTRDKALLERLADA